MIRQSNKRKTLSFYYLVVIEGLAAKATEKGTETTRECYEIAKSLQKDRKRKHGEDETEDDDVFDESMFEKDGGADDEMDCDEDSSKKKKKTASKKKKGKKKKARKVW